MPSIWKKKKLIRGKTSIPSELFHRKRPVEIKHPNHSEMNWQVGCDLLWIVFIDTSIFVFQPLRSFWRSCAGSVVCQLSASQQRGKVGWHSQSQVLQSCPWVWNNHSSTPPVLLRVGFCEGTGKSVHSSSISVFPFYHQLSLLHLWKSSLLRKASKSTQMSSTTQTTWKPPGITSKPPQNICKASGALFLVTVYPKLNIRAWAPKFFRQLWICLSKGWNPQFTLILEHVCEFQNEKSCYFYCRTIYKWSSLLE